MVSRENPTPGKNGQATPDVQRPCQNQAAFPQMPTYRRLPSIMPSGLARQWAWPELEGTGPSLPSTRPFVASPDTRSAKCSNSGTKTLHTLPIAMLTKLRLMIYPDRPQTRVIRWQKDTSGATSVSCGSNFMLPRLEQRPTSSFASFPSPSHYQMVRLTVLRSKMVPLLFALLFAGWTLFGTTLGSLSFLLLFCWAWWNAKP